MYDKLLLLDRDLYYKYQDIEKNISSFSRTVYVSMQAFLERFVKLVLKDEKYTIEKRNALGPLLDDTPVLKIILEKYNFQDIEIFKQINLLGNMYKHSQDLASLEIKEGELFKYYQSLTELISLYLESKNFTGFKPIRKDYFDSLLSNFNAYVLNKSGISENEQEISNLKSIIEKLEKEKSELSTTLGSGLDIDDQIIKINASIRALNDKVSNLDTDLNEVNEDNILEKERISTDIQATNEEISILRAKKEDLFSIRKNRGTSAISNRYSLIIKEQEEKINELNKIIQESKASNKNLNQFNTSYDNKSKFLFNYQTNRKYLSFESTYLSKDYFEIYNIDKRLKTKSIRASFYAVIHNLMIRGKNIKPSNYILGQKLKENDLKAVYRFQITILSLIRYGILDDNVWKINVEEPFVNLLNIAITDIFDNVERLISITKLKYNRPILEINNNTGVKLLIDEYSDEADSVIIKTSLKNNNQVLSSIWISDKIEYSLNTSKKHQEILEYFLEYIFGFKKFKNGQIEIIANYLKNINTIGVLPTGGGKSLTYYIAVLLQPKSSLIIAPITSLIKDQTDKLRKQFNIDSVIELTSNIGRDLKNQYYDEFINGRVLFTFATPERAQNVGFRNALVKLSYDNAIGTVVLDEVHCLSEWGHDFRISYLMLSKTLNDYCRGVNYLGLTATASVNVVKDLIVELNIARPEENIIYSKKLRRDNLQFGIKTFSSMEDALNNIHQELIYNKNSESDLNIKLNGEETNGLIIFCPTKKGKSANSIERVSYKLGQDFKDEIAIYHGENKQSQDEFMDNAKSLLIATKAFGMGVDKPNIRYTIHLGMPSSREAFYQEAGRAGRDGKISKCLLYSADIPYQNTKELSSLLSLRTSVSDLKKLKFQNDLNTVLFFLTNNIDEPATEVDKAIEYLRELITINKQLYFVKEFGDEKGNVKTENERTLYFLHKLGIVDDWSIEYKGYDHIVINGKLNPSYADIEHVKRSSIEYISHYSPNPRDIENISKIKDYRSQLRDLMLIIKTWYHDTFIRSRREQISNMYTFIQKYKSKNTDYTNSSSIQDELDRFFDLSELIKTDNTGLDFDNKSYFEIIEQAFIYNQSNLSNHKITLERLLESTVNLKLDLYTSIIHLRLGEFAEIRNGKERLLYFLKETESIETDSIIRRLLERAHNHNLSSKYDLYEAIIEYNHEYLKTIYQINENDTFVNGMLARYINKMLDIAGVK